MLTLSFFLITLCAIAYVGETLEKDSTPSSLPKEEAPLSPEKEAAWLAKVCSYRSPNEWNAHCEQELSEIYMLAKESLLESASNSAPYEN